MFVHTYNMHSIFSCILYSYTLYRSSYSVYMQYRYTVTMIYTHAYTSMIYTYIHTYTHTHAYILVLPITIMHVMFTNVLLCRCMYILTWTVNDYWTHWSACTYTYILYHMNIKFCRFYVNSSS